MKKVLFTIFFLLALGFGALKYLEHNSFYFPDKKIDATPHDLSLPYEEVTLTSKDNVTLHGWFVPKAQSRVTVLFLHGNAGNISHRVEKLALLNEMGASTLIIDYRGYGRSSGNPTEQGLYRDAHAAYEYLCSVRGVDPNTIVVYGESLGSAVAIALARTHPCEGLVLEGAFSSSRDMAQARFPYIPRFLIANTFDSLTKIKEVQAPVIFIHGKSDEVVPCSLAKKLFDAYGGRKKFCIVPGHHNDIVFVSQKQYQDCVRDFFDHLSGTRRDN